MKCEIIPTTEPLKAAAFAGKHMPRFMHAPKALMEIMTDTNENKQANAGNETRIDYAADETAKEETPVEEPNETNAETITVAEANKRVAGMQSAMAKQLDALRKECDARIIDFENQLKARNEELETAKAEATRLAERLESANNENAELQKKVSAAETALAEKENALATLNAGVLTPNEATDWRTLKGKAFFDYLREHPEAK